MSSWRTRSERTDKRRVDTTSTLKPRSVAMVMEREDS